MKTYFIDTNVFVRFLLQDNAKMYKAAADFFRKAKKHQYRLIVMEAVIFEIEYVLRKVYKISREEIGRAIKKLVHWDCIEINNRSAFSRAADIYKDIPLDLVDIVLYYQALDMEAEIFSFDKGFKKFNKPL